MPIAAMGDYSEQHWLDVREILEQSIASAGFFPNIVSDADEIGVIQKRIVENLYENPIVVCDLSGKNPNVMFELGLRLAFDKPTIIVKDHLTSYSFDTGLIEHLTYPRDLHHKGIEGFKKNLAGKLKHTLHAARTDKEFSPFLKHFGTYRIAKLNDRDATSMDLINEQLGQLKSMLSSVYMHTAGPGYRSATYFETVPANVQAAIDHYLSSPSRQKSLMGMVSHLQELFPEIDEEQLMQSALKVPTYMLVGSVLDE